MVVVAWLLLLVQAALGLDQEVKLFVFWSTFFLLLYILQPLFLLTLQ